MRSLIVAVGLTAVLTFSHISSGFAGSADQKAQASYRSNVSQPVSRASETPTNCIREACGRLWCWNMGKSSNGR